MMLYYTIHLVLALWSGASIMMLVFIYRRGWRSLARWQRAYIWVLGGFAGFDALFYLIVAAMHGPFAGSAGNPTIISFLRLLVEAWYAGILLTLPLMIWGTAVGAANGVRLFSRPSAGQAA